MKTHIRTIIVVVAVLLASVITACSRPTPEMVLETVVVEKTVEVEKVVEEIAEAVNTVEPAVAATPVASPAVPGGAHSLPAAVSRPNRMIIKNADMQLTVEDTDVAIDLVTQVVGDAGGYIISSRVWYQEWLDEQYKYASLTVGCLLYTSDAADE